jgi:Fe-S-cluster containining protein
VKKKKAKAKVKKAAAAAAGTVMPSKKTREHALPEALRGRRTIKPGGRFRFGCHAGLACFNTCCADVNILLTPVDVVGLSRSLGIKTGEFIEKYTLTPVTKDLHLPVLVLKMNEGPGKKCPFVGPAGCTVYDDRPWACRMYPLGMGLPPARAGEEPEPVYFLFEDDFCKGRSEPDEWTVERWRNDQGVSAREEIEEGYRGVVSHPWFIGGRHLDPKRMEMFHMACYDLDKFRDFIFNSTFLSRFELDDTLITSLRDYDEALLRFAFRWLRFALFAEPTMKAREGAPDARRKA